VPRETASAWNQTPARTALAWAAGTLLLAAALWLRLRMLDYQPLWLDEGKTWAVVTQSRLGSLLLGLLLPTEAYPLYHVLLKPVLRLLGDSEFALRLPSAIAGALAVPALLALGRELRGWMLGVCSALLLLLAPWAIGQAQDAKAYSLVLLTAILLALALARALRIQTRRAWLVFVVVACMAPFVHRLLVFSLLGCAVAWAVWQQTKQTKQTKQTENTEHRTQNAEHRTQNAEHRTQNKAIKEHVVAGAGDKPENSKLETRNSKLETRNSKLPLLILCASLLAGVALVAGLGITQDVQRAGGQFADVGPLRAAWLTFGQWTTGQWPGTLRRLYLVPFGLLALLGAARLGWDVWHGNKLRGALVLLALGGVPALLFAALLSWRAFYEPRYLTIIYPFWLLLLGWAVPEIDAKAQRRKEENAKTQRRKAQESPASPASRFSILNSQFSILCTLLLVLCALYASTRALFVPERGIFSGAIVKEDYRGAVRELAEHVHPDDLVIVHPDTVVPLYQYYAPRVANWQLPRPTFYPWLGRAGVDRDTERRELDVKIRADLGSVPRAWLLIAPEHAKVVDPPLEGDRFGLVGLAFEYGDSNGRLMCGTGNAERAYAGFVGVSLYCNNMPSVDGKIPQPELRTAAVFGGDLRLRGYSVEPFADGLRAGGPLPLTLFWEPLHSLAGTDYVVFVHLTRPDDPTPLVQIDGQPLEGGLPTGLWTEPLAQLHDERTLMLRDEAGQPLEPGRYVLRLGVYRRADGSRLAVSDTDAPALDEAIVLGEVEVLPAAGASGR